MPDQLNTRQLRDLKATGWSSQETSTRAPKCWWLRADGTLLPNKLPVDPYHMDRYMKRGWHPLPPRTVVTVVDGVLTVGQMDEEEGDIPGHTHRYAKTMGSPCSGAAGCLQVRTTPYRHRKAHIAEVK